MAFSWVVLALYAGLATSSAFGRNVCEELESQGQLISQRLKTAKTCKESTVANGWTDCILAAGKTEIRVAGAIGTTKQERALGYSGSGFWILSIDDGMLVRSMNDPRLGPLLLVEAKDAESSSGCAWNL